MSKNKLILLVLLLINFFGLTHISNTILLLLLMPGIIKGIKKQTLFRPYLKYLIISIFLSYLSSFHFERQTILQSFAMSANIFYILIYFFFIGNNISFKVVEKTLTYLSILFCCVYIIQFILLPFNIYIFSFGENIKEASSEARFRLPASGFCSLAYFMGLNGVLLKKDIKKSFFLMIIGFTVLLLMAFRTMIFGLVIFSLILYFKTIGFNVKIIKSIFLTIGAIVIVYSIPIFQSKINYMIEKQEEGQETFDNEDYVRMRCLNYYTTEKLTNPIEYIFGMGLPHEKSKLGKEQSDIAEAYGYHYVDWGLLGYSWCIGIIPIIIMILYVFRAFFIRCPSNYNYLGVWFLYLLIISVTTSEFYRNGNFVIQGLVLYMLYYLKLKKEKNENRNNNLSPRT